MSAAVSASRTCSGPDRMSTMRPRECPVALAIRRGGSIGRAGCSTTVVLITPVAPGKFWGGPDSASPTRSISLAPAEPASDHARRSFATGSRFAAARHGVELKPMADQFVAELIGNDFL